MPHRGRPDDCGHRRDRLLRRSGQEARSAIVPYRLRALRGYPRLSDRGVPRWGKDIGTWFWRENLFVDTQQLAGLFVMMVMVNNWDLKAAQNGIYRVESENQDPRHWYVVKDLGASLGATNWFFPGTRDDIKGFEKEPFIAGVEGNRVRFHYKGAWLEPQLLDSVTPDDVCALGVRAAGAPVA